MRDSLLRKAALLKLEQGMETLKERDGMHNLGGYANITQRAWVFWNEAALLASVISHEGTREATYQEITDTIEPESKKWYIFPATKFVDRAKEFIASSEE